MRKFFVQQFVISVILSVVMYLFPSCWSTPPKPPSEESEVNELGQESFDPEPL